MKKAIRIFSLLLAAIMVLSMVPLTAYADNPTVATVRIGTNDKFTDYNLRDKQENKITPEGCKGTISATNAGSQIRVYLDNFTCNLPVKITYVSRTDIPLYIEYSGNTTIAYEDTEFPYYSVRNNFSAFYVIPQVSAYLTGRDASSVLNISYIQPTEADFMQPKDAMPIYTGIYTTGSLNFAGKGTVNVDVQSYITEGGDNTGDGDGCISTVGIYAGGAVYFNTSELTDASNLNVNVNAKLAPGTSNDGYVCGIQAGAFLNDASANSMYFGGKGQMNVHTDADEVYGNVQIWNIDARNQKIRFAAAYEGSKFFQGRLNLTSDCPCNKPFRNPTEPTFVAASTSYTKKMVGDRELSYTYSAPQKVKLALEDEFGFYENVETAFTGTLDYKGVSGFTVLPDACFIVDYDAYELAEEPELSFDGNKMTVKVLPCDWGYLYDTFTVRIVGYDTVDKTKSYAFDQIYTLWVSEAEVKEFVSVYDMGKTLDLCYSNYDGYDDYHDDPLGYYDPMNDAMQVGYTGYMNGCDFKFVNDMITFTTNEDFFSTTGLKFTETDRDMFNGEFQTTEFSIWGTLPNLNIDTTFVYVDHEIGAKAPTVYKQRFITVKTTANAFKNYFIKNKAVSETVASGSNALGTKIIYTNAGEFGLTAKNSGTLKYEVTLTGTPTKTGKVIVVYEVAKRLLNHKTERTRYYAEYQVLDSEPTVRNFGTAQVGTAFTKSMENPAGSISTGGSTLGKTGLKASYGVNTTISGTPTTAGEYYFITDIYLSKEAKHIYYKDVVTVTDPSKAPVITQQPVNCEYVKGGNNPQFKVTATGDDLTYQWYWGTSVLTMDGPIAGYAVSGGKTNTLTINSKGLAFGTWADKDVYCVITNANGKVTTNKVKIVEITPKFTTQPVNCTAALNNEGSFKAVFEKTTGVTYQWYTADGTALNDGSAAAWTISGAKTGTLKVTAKTPFAYTIAEFYCEATYQGGKFKSNTAKLVKPHTCADSITKVAGKAATCTAAGVKEHYKCTMCEKLYADAAATKALAEKDVTIAALGHNWDAGVVTKEATESTKGEKTFTCARCKQTKKETFNYEKPSTPEFMYGDIDADTKVTASDARLALRASVGLEKYNAGTKQFLAADVDLDNKISSSDARLILRFAVGLEKKLGK